jgi:hypothetical protein
VQLLRDCVALIADTAELFMQRHTAREPPMVMIAEGRFVKAMQLFTQPMYLSRYGADGTRLLESWRRVQQSGVLQRRRLDLWP